MIMMAFAVINDFPVHIRRFRYFPFSDNQFACRFIHRMFKRNISGGNEYSEEPFINYHIETGS